MYVVNSFSWYVSLDLFKLQRTGHMPYSTSIYLALKMAIKAEIYLL